DLPLHFVVVCSTIMTFSLPGRMAAGCDGRWRGAVKLLSRHMGIVVLGFVLHIAGVAGADTAVRFNADIRSIFVSNCFTCHGPDCVPRKAGLRLDDDSTLFTQLPTGATAVVPGDRTRSALFQRIASADPSQVMPPADSGKSLSAAEIE